LAGIYIHIPFCKQACTYCNFHFSASLALKDKMIEAIVREIELTNPFNDTGDKIRIDTASKTYIERAKL